MNGLIVLLLAIIIALVIINYILRRTTSGKDGSQLADALQGQISSNFSAAQLSKGTPVEGDQGQCAVYRWNSGEVKLTIPSVESDNVTRLNEAPSCLLPNEYYLQKVTRTCTVIDARKEFDPSAPTICIAPNGSVLDPQDEVQQYVSCLNNTVPRCGDLYAQIEIDGKCITDRNSKLVQDNCASLATYTTELDRQLFAVYDATGGPPVKTDQGISNGQTSTIDSLPNFFYLATRDKSLQLVQVNRDGTLELDFSGAVFALSNSTRTIQDYRVTDTGQFDFTTNDVPASLLVYDAFSPEVTTLVSSSPLHIQSVVRHGNEFRAKYGGAPATIRTLKPYDGTN